MLFTLLNKLTRPKPLPPIRPPQPRPLINGGSRTTWSLDEPLVWLNDIDCLTTRDFFEGGLALGNPGSGKSSTTGTIIPLAALCAGFGVLTYTTKPDDIDVWRKLCEESGRTRDLIVIRPRGAEHFNLLRYEFEQRVHGGGSTLAIVDTLFEVFKEGEPKSSRSDTSQYFETQAKMLLSECVDCHALAGEVPSLDGIASMINSAPLSPAEIGTDRWFDSYCYRLLAKADAATEAGGDRDLYDKVTTYFTKQFPEKSDRTRADILSTVEGALFHLTREPLRGLLDSKAGCSIRPDQLGNGAVVVVDCPPCLYGLPGRMVAIGLKRVCKEYMLRRKPDGDRTRPILHFLDEAQVFCTKDDAAFCQVVRSNRVGTFMLTQSIDNLDISLGGEAELNSLANALTALFCHCTSGKTAHWVQQRIAQSFKKMESIGYSGTNSAGGAESHRGPSVNHSEHLYPRVMESELTSLRTGGAPHGSLVDLVVFKPGRTFARTNAPFCRVTFQQR